MTDLDKALDYLLIHEGGWSNHAADRGGATMFGITQGTYDQWRDTIKKPRQTVRRVAKEEVRQLYESMYWNAAGCNRLPWPMSYLVFDAAVNSGPSRGVRWLQAGLRLAQDGKIGPKTIEAARKAVDEGDAGAVLRIVDARLTFLVDLVKRSPSQIAFLLGWMRRLQGVLATALTSTDSE